MDQWYEPQGKPWALFRSKLRGMDPKRFKEVMMHSYRAGYVLFVTLFICSPAQPVWADDKGGDPMELRSPAFARDAMIPPAYTCDGTDVSPPLAWSGVPEAARSIALICDDPDAPSGTWVHWVYYDLPAKTTSLPEGVGPADHPTAGGSQGRNDFKKAGYGGPCPPSGTHRYFFRLYALDIELNLPPGRTREELLHAMEGHILATAELMGTYKRR